MVRNYKRISDRGSYGEKALQQAMKETSQGVPVNEAAKSYGVPLKTLRRHVNGEVVKPGKICLGRLYPDLPGRAISKGCYRPILKTKKNKNRLEERNQEVAKKKMKQRQESQRGASSTTAECRSQLEERNPEERKRKRKHCETTEELQDVIALANRQSKAIADLQQNVQCLLLQNKVGDEKLRENDKETEELNVEELLKDLSICSIAPELPILHVQSQPSVIDLYQQISLIDELQQELRNADSKIKESEETSKKLKTENKEQEDVIANLQDEIQRMDSEVKEREEKVQKLEATNKKQEDVSAEHQKESQRMILEMKKREEKVNNLKRENESLTEKCRQHEIRIKELELQLNSRGWLNSAIQTLLGSISVVLFSRINQIF